MVEELPELQYHRCQVCEVSVVPGVDLVADEAGVGELAVVATEAEHGRVAFG